jgi:hypothetical protein
MSVAARPVTLARLAQAGVIPTSTHSVVAELPDDVGSPGRARVAASIASIAPNYIAVIESHLAAAAHTM